MSITGSAIELTWLCAVMRLCSDIPVANAMRLWAVITAISAIRKRTSAMNSYPQQALFNVEQTQKTSNDHYTPKWIFDLLNVEFDIDVASPPGGVPWIPCKRYFTQLDDGLSQDWQGLIWCNPPYSDVDPWVAKMMQHRNGIMLLPYVKSSWRLQVWKDADSICEPDSVDRIKFIHLGKEKEIMFPTFLAGWGVKATKALTRLGHVR